ncbi:hypothetical protein TrVGV298_000759 [Trichoderma virens]|nr:hypothetical protein TrVGV298_000759 [Trichoderma virens]
MATTLTHQPAAAGPATTTAPFSTAWSSRYRGATVEDLDPPAALSPTQTRALLGYISIPHLQSLLEAGRVQPSDPLSAAMTRFQRKGRTYRVITMQTPLEELEAFFRGDKSDGTWKEEFAVVTDENRRFVLGVATVQDLEEFVKRRPA